MGNDADTLKTMEEGAIRKLLDLPDDREVYAGVTMGYPKYKFKRLAPRNLAEVRYLE